MLNPIDIHAPQFTAADAARIADVDPGLLKLWIKRGLLEPARIERLTVRRRPHFSIVTIFKLKLMLVVGESLSVGPSKMKGAADQAALEAEKKTKLSSGPTGAALVRAVADDGWMWAVARSAERGAPLNVMGAATLSNECWDFRLYPPGANFTPGFGDNVPYAVLPLGAIFSSVYRDCRTLLAKDTHRRSGKRRDG